MLRRCVKSIPHPDSPEFHHNPLKAPGAFAVDEAEPGGRQTTPPGAVAGTVATQRLLAGSTESALVPAVPTQSVDPPTFVASTLSRTFTDCCWLETTLPTTLRFEAEACCSCPDGSSWASTHAAPSLSCTARFTTIAGA